jgi:hypothetical protein
MNSELDELSRRVEQANAQEARRAEIVENARVQAIVVEARERIIRAVVQERWGSRMHEFAAHYDEVDHPGCVRCPWPKDHPVHSGVES